MRAGVYKVIDISRSVILVAMRRFHLHTLMSQRATHGTAPKVCTMNYNDPDFHVRLIQPGLFTVHAECVIMGGGGRKVRKLEHIKHH